jgi:DNA-binding beta-propeller fold protein YncE
MQIAQRLRSIAISALLALVLSGSLCAQDQPDSRVLRGPVIGFVYEQTLGIRPILGIPGAATLGPAVLARDGVESVTLAPGGDYAMAVLANGRQVAIVRNLSTVPSAAVVDVSAGPARIAFSPTGDAAAFYYSDTARAEVLTGLPGSPTLAWNFDLAGLQSGLGALAINDGGGALLVAAAGEPAPIWLATPEVGQRFLYAASASPSLTFLFRSEDAAIADASTGDLVLVRDPKGEAKLTRIGGPAQGISRPVAIAATRDNRRILVANATPAGVVSLELSGDQPVKLACACAPTALERLAGGSVFRVSEPGNGPIWLLDTAGSTPRIVFVPDQMRLLRDTGRAPVPRGSGSVR